MNNIGGQGPSALNAPSNENVPPAADSIAGEILELRRREAQCRRLAAAVGDRETQFRLLTLAEEYAGQADRLAPYSA